MQGRQTIFRVLNNVIGQFLLSSVPQTKLKVV